MAAMDAPGSHDRQLNLLRALLACDQAMIRSTRKADLFEAVCAQLVQTGGLQLAWIGLQDVGDARLWPQAHQGVGQPYEAWAAVAARAEPVPGQALAAAAVASQQPVWLLPTAVAEVAAPAADPLSGLSPGLHWPWAAALPLHIGPRCCGVLCLYSHSSHALDEPARALLQELAVNMGTALTAMERNDTNARNDLELRESEARYNALFANNPMPILVVNPADGRIVDANAQAQAFYGWDLQTLTGKCIEDIRVQGPEEVRQEMEQANAEGRAYQEFQHRLAGGKVRDVEVFTSPMTLHNQTYLVTAMHDVTERRLLHAQAQQSQTLMQQFIDQLPGTAFVKGSDLRLVMANRKLCTLLGADPATLVGKTAHDLFPREFADYVTLLDREVLDTGGERVFEESFQDRHNETSMFVIGDGSGARFLAGLSLDVTDNYHARERTSALLRINEMAGEVAERELLTTGLELAEKLTHSQIGFLHFVNEDQETLELVTWTSGALKGCTAAYDSHYPVSRAGIWADCVRKSAPVVFNDYAHMAAKQGLPSGHAPITRLISAPILDGGKVRMILGVGNKGADYLQDDVETLLLLGNELWRIARRNRLETSLKARVGDLVEANKRLADMQLQLLQSEKMASIGQLASGVAHEINNPIGFVKSNLGSLQGYVDSLLGIVRAYEAVEHIHGEAVTQALGAIALRKKDMDYDFVVEDVRKLIEESNEGVLRVSKIVQDLKNFSRTGDVTAEPADLQAGIESTINVVWNQLKYKVDVVREYTPLPPIRCVISQINQVVMNLLINAEQSIAEHGTIVVRTGTDGGSVWFEVQDSGCGIAADKLPRIFEPFYTSKPVGQGTGLGLSISFGIVQRHGGTITVQSAPGRGSTFRVTLPVEPLTDAQEPAWIYKA